MRDAKAQEPARRDQALTPRPSRTNHELGTFTTPDLETKPLELTFPPF